MNELIVFSGAGISAESGLSTFRDNGGLWENFKVEQVATYLNWKDRFNTIHDFYNMRRKDCEKAEPNLAHKTIASWEKKYNLKNLTQNIDTLFEKAGCSNVFHLHGKIDEMHCDQCGQRWNIGFRNYDPEIDICQCGCKKKIKPNVVFFGEFAPLYKVLYKSFTNLSSDDVVVVVGTSSQVININKLLENTPCTKINVNMQHSGTNVYDHEFIGTATENIMKVDQLLETL